MTLNCFLNKSAAPMGYALFVASNMVGWREKTVAVTGGIYLRKDRFGKPNAGISQMTLLVIFARTAEEK
jgi:hypothetical protein